MSAASKNLKAHQRQLDMDGCEVGVSRQAVEETLAEYADILAALKAACGYLMNAKIDLETGAPKRTAIRTIDGGLALVRAAITKANGTAP